MLLTFQRVYTLSAIEDILLGQSKYIFSEKLTRFSLLSVTILCIMEVMPELRWPQPTIVSSLR